MFWLKLNPPLSTTLHRCILHPLSIFPYFSGKKPKTLVMTLHWNLWNKNHTNCQEILTAKNWLWNCTYEVLSMSLAALYSLQHKANILTGKVILYSELDVKLLLYTLFNTSIWLHDFIGSNSSHHFSPAVLKISRTKLSSPVLAALISIYNPRRAFQPALYLDASAQMLVCLIRRAALSLWELQAYLKARRKCVPPHFLSSTLKEWLLHYFHKAAGEKLD